MKVIKLVSYLLFSIVASDLFAQIETEPDYPVRLDISYTAISSRVESFDDYRESIRQYGGAGTYQASFGLFAQAGLAYSDVHDFTINNLDSNSADNFSTWFVGAGFRFGPLSRQTNYWGIGYQFSDSNLDGVSAVNTVRLFSEKDNLSRYGIVQIIYSYNDGNDFIALKGRHIWYVSRSIGVGFSWGIGGGKSENRRISSGTVFVDDGDLGAGNLGVNLVYRPRI